VIRGEKGIDEGDKVQVRLASVEVDKGFIDFEGGKGATNVALIGFSWTNPR